MITRHEKSGPIPLRRILVATDFSPAARRAVWRAGQLAKQNAADLHLVHARPDWNQFASINGAAPESYRRVTDHAEHALREELSYIRSSFDIHVRGETRIGRASEVLRSAIAEVEPHLVVVGARGEHDARALVPFLGGTALKLLAYADRPILIVRREGEGPYKTSVVAVEYASEAARDLVLWARTLLHEGDCHVVHAFDAPFAQRMRRHGVSEAAVQESSEAVRAGAMTFVDQMLDVEGPPGQRVHAHLVCGEAVSAVLAEVERCKPDLVVVGKHGHPPRERHLRSLGSVALRIAYHVTQDVLVAP